MRPLTKVVPTLTLRCVLELEIVFEDDHEQRSSQFVAGVDKDENTLLTIGRYLSRNDTEGFHDGCDEWVDGEPETRG